MAGLVIEGVVTTPSLAATSGAGKATTPARQTTAANTTKTVVYRGYEFQVPASWPVYRLDQHPQTCVRYDVHAVYLGKPGQNMRCAAGLIGRTQTISFIPGQRGVTGASAPSPERAAGTGDTRLQRGGAVHGTVRQNRVRHELSVAVGDGTPRPGATLLGTYGADPKPIEQVLNTLHQAPARARQSAQTEAAPGPPGGTSTSWHGLPAHWPTQIVQSPPQPTPWHPVAGFDACTAPSLATMHAWRSAYAAVGMYLGGANYACAYGNLSAGWVRSVLSSGWGLLPTYVGPQAPCWGGKGVTINPSRAVAEGRAAATDAVSEARSFHLGVGSPIYYDMEAYKGGTSCTNAVLRFLGAWDRQVAAAGYLTGVYASQDSGITDLQAAAVARVAGFTPPDAVWIALWDGKPSLNDGDLVWPLRDRDKQYAGTVNESVGGITLNIDRDVVGGPVVR